MNSLLTHTVGDPFLIKRRSLLITLIIKIPAKFCLHNHIAAQQHILLYADGGNTATA